MTDYDVTQYTCNDGNIAKILIPNNVTEDDFRGLYELLQVVAVRRFGLDLSERDAVQGWIPCSERLPEAEDMYQPPEQRYLCQLEAYGERKFCVLSRLKGAISPFWDWYGVAVHDSEVTAWMPLPNPYKGGDE